MELNLFKAFLAVAEARSFSRAAVALNVTQPALSRQIARLESELGTQLFERYGRHVECTSGGEFLLPLAQMIVARTEETVSLMRERAGSELTTVRLGATGMVFVHFLTPILTSFITTYPAVRVDLMEADDVGLEQAVLDGRLDFAVYTVWRSTRAALRHLLTEEIVLLIAPEHPLAQEDAVRLDMLGKINILVPPAGLNISSIITDAFRRAGIEPKIPYRALFPELIKDLARKGWGVAPMPKGLTSPDYLGDLVALPFEPKLERELGLIYPWDRPLPAAARALMAEVQRQLSSAAVGSVKPRETPDRSRRPRRTVGGPPRTEKG